MDGLINLYKPVGISSARALDRVRRITGVRKSGHAGTLDPAAEGVLVLCLGRATKLVELLMDQPKIYQARARLDVTSESYDAESTLSPVPVETPPDLQRLQEVCRGFEGRIAQVPPTLSAVKVRGRPAYHWHRAGTPPKLRPKLVTIHNVRIERYDWPQLVFEITCGRGTYVRALIRDLGERLNTGGCLTSLVRTAVGPFTSRDAWRLDRLEQASDPQQYLIPLGEARELLIANALTPPQA